MLAKKIAAPHAARNFLKALRGMMATAIRAGYATGGFRTWTEEEIAQFEVAHPVGSRAQLAFGLLLYTAQRRGDVVRMGRQDIHDGFIRVRQQKTGAMRNPGRAPG
jgi:integrase